MLLIKDMMLQPLRTGAGVFNKINKLRPFLLPLLLIRLVPAPGIGAGAALEDTLAIHIGDHIGVPGEQGFGRTHSGTERYLALGYPVLTVEMLFLGTEVFLGTAGTEGALIHCSPCPEDIAFGELRGTERTGHKAVAAADAGLFIDQHDPVLPLIDGINGTDRKTRGIGTMHARNRDGFLARFSLVEGNHPAAIDTYGNMVPFFTGDDTAATVDAAVGIA